MATTQWHSTIERTVTGLDYELVNVERSSAGLLRVFIDRIPGHVYPTGMAESVTVDDCERVTRQLQYVLEVEGLLYERLEVSSPGLDRLLKQPADYERFAGHEVNVTLKLPFKGRKNYRGQLMSGPNGWRLALALGVNGKDGKDGEQALDFSFDEVREARLVPVLDFKGRARPGAQLATEQVSGIDGGQTQ